MENGWERDRCAPPSEEGSTPMRTGNFKQTPGFTDRLFREAARWRDKAEKLPQGPDRDALIRKARQAE